jgi:hypothetical protein
LPGTDSIVEGDIRWHHGQTLAAGQVAEFKVWAELVRQSIGGLHLFLPLRDFGIDGVLHRLRDSAYIAIQVKGRTSLTPAGQVHITVTASSLVDDEAFIIATLIDGPDLGRMVLVISEAEFRRLAAHDVVAGREYLTAAFEMRVGGHSRWAPYLVPRESLAERFQLAAPRIAATRPPEGTRRAAEGFLGEAEVIRRLAESDSLALFRPFPDLETVELLVRELTSKRWCGLQVKTAGWDASHLETRVHFRRSSFRAAPSTFVCVLGWERVAHRFADNALLVPSEDVARLARPERDWLVLELQPGSPAHRQLERYLVPRDLLGRAVLRVI